ncbi:MAG: deoxyribose-phosphate aldolase [Haloplasmataceae bacterium]|jgi:deoxyribose-phosphate aldolase|nr:deoxyribose-phosphate aldolase [Haloplasmataceae bacterium]
MNLNKYIDHTALKPQTTVDDIVILCEEARKYNFKSVCVNPSNISHCIELLKGTDVLVCTVIGFPLGATTIETKVFETKQAISIGADEIDMVINIGRAKIHDFDYIEREIREVVSAAKNMLVKVIIETCLLTNEEKVSCCLAAKSAGAAFVKTSTGFSTSGATKEDIALMRETVGKEMGVKASGGVRSKEDCLIMIKNGATRIGTSNGVKIMEDELVTSGY